MRKYLLLAGLLFVVGMGVVVGVRMSPDAMAVIIGIIFGLIASVPTSLMLVWVLRQRDKQFEAQMGQGRPFGHYPPVVVVNGQGTAGYGGALAPPVQAANSLSGARSFKVIGQENTETIGDVLPAFWDEI